MTGLPPSGKSTFIPEVALVYPPLVDANFGSYYPSTAVLAGYLAAKGIDSIQTDLNEDFAAYILKPESLKSMADGEFAKIQEFLGEGDFSTHPVEPKLKRSDTEHKPHRLWEIAEKMYELMGKQDYDGVIECYSDHANEINRDKITTKCVRLQETVTINQCHSCILAKACRTSFRKRADAKLIDWRNEPCMFKCMSEPDVDEHQSMEDSIKNNSWSDTV